MPILPNVRQRAHLPHYNSLRRPTYPYTSWGFEAQSHQIDLARILNEANAIGADVVVVHVSPKFVRRVEVPKTHRGRRRLGFQSPYRYGARHSWICLNYRAWGNRSDLKLAPFDWFPTVANTWCQIEADSKTTSQVLEQVFTGNPTRNDGDLKPSVGTVERGPLAAPSECRWSVRVVAYNAEQVRRWKQQN